MPGLDPGIHAPAAKRMFPMLYVRRCVNGWNKSGHDRGKWRLGSPGVLPLLTCNPRPRGGSCSRKPPLPQDAPGGVARRRLGTQSLPSRRRSCRSGGLQPTIASPPALPQAKARLLNRCPIIAATGCRVERISLRSILVIAAPNGWLKPPPAEIEALRSSVRATRARHTFHIDAWVVLPDHMHCTMTLPTGDRLPGSVADYQRHVLTIRPAGGRAACIPGPQARGRHLATPVLGAHDPRRPGLRRSYGLHPFQSGATRARRRNPPVGCSATIWMKAGGDQDECRDRADGA